MCPWRKNKTDAVTKCCLSCSSRFRLKASNNRNKRTPGLIQTWMDFRNWRKKGEEEKEEEKNILWCTNYNRNQVRSTTIACVFILFYLSLSLFAGAELHQKIVFFTQKTRVVFSQKIEEVFRIFLEFFTIDISSEPGWSTRTPRHQLHHCFWDVSFTAGRMSCTSAAWTRLTRARRRHRTKGRHDQG